MARASAVDKGVTYVYCVSACDRAEPTIRDEAHTEGIFANVVDAVKPEEFGGAGAMSVRPQDIDGMTE